MNDRNVPYSMEAEESTIGAAILRPSILVDLSGVLDPTDFYNPRLAQAYAAMLELFDHGDPIDQITISAKTLNQVTIQELTLLTTAVPSVSAYNRYSQIVIEMSRRRRMIAHFAEQIERCYEPSADVDEILNASDPGADRLVAPRTSDINDLFTLAEFMTKARTHDDKREWLIPHVMKALWRVIIVAPEGIGKACEALTNPILTANRGWLEFGDLAVGDRLFDERGEQCAITAVHPVIHDHDCWTVRFSDGSEIVTSGNHPWVTLDYAARQPDSPTLNAARVVTTSEIRGTLRARGGHCLNHAVPTAGPLAYVEADLPIDPYLLGVWLGDGETLGARIASADLEIAEAFTDAGYTARHLSDSGGGCPVWSISTGPSGLSFRRQLREAEVLGNKHIPRRFMTGSASQRLALLQGLMDTDGYVPKLSPTGRGGGASVCEFVSVRRQLADGVLELCLSLGIKARMVTDRAQLQGRDYGERHRITFQSDLPVFRLGRKSDRLIPLRTRRAKLRYVTAVEPHATVPTRCISVDSPSRLYLTGRTLIPTHNTLMRFLALHAAAGRDPWSPLGQTDSSFVERRRVLYIDVENAQGSIMHQVQIANRGRAFNVDIEAEAARHFHLWHREGGINLRDRRPRAELEAILTKVRPEIVFAGPLYKLYRRSPREDLEMAALEFTEVLDDFRVRFGFGLVLEHHAPKASGGGYREMNPFGSALWMKWPEFGITLEPVGQIAHGDTEYDLEVGRFRRDREIADWPNMLSRGKSVHVPWSPRWNRARGSVFNDVY